LICATSLENTMTTVQIGQANSMGAFHATNAPLKQQRVDLRALEVMASSGVSRRRCVDWRV